MKSLMSKLIKPFSEIGISFVFIFVIPFILLYFYGTEYLIVGTEALIDKLNAWVLDLKYSIGWAIQGVSPDEQHKVITIKQILGILSGVMFFTWLVGSNIRDRRIELGTRSRGDIICVSWKVYKVLLLWGSFTWVTWMLGVRDTYKSIELIYLSVTVGIVFMFLQMFRYEKSQNS